MKRKFLLKKFINLRKNVQNKKKNLNFKRKKWQKLLQFLHNSKFRYYKTFDHNRFVTNRYPEYFNNTHRNDLYDKQRFCYFYGSFKIKYIKNIMKRSINYNDKFAKTKFRNSIECRLDVILYRSNLVDSVKKARQLIIHKCIKVNKAVVKTSSVLLKKGDLLSIKPKCWKIIKNSVQFTDMWPFAPEYLQINYRTLQIILLNDPSMYNFNVQFPYLINFNSIVQYYRYH